MVAVAGTKDLGEFSRCSSCYVSVVSLLTVLFCGLDSFRAIVLRNGMVHRVNLIKIRVTRSMRSANWIACTTGSVGKGRKALLESGKLTRSWPVPHIPKTMNTVSVKQGIQGFDANTSMKCAEIGNTCAYTGQSV